MCPLQETLQRKPHIFERTTSGKLLFIKQYGRSAADKSVSDPEQVRPLHLIKLVVDYLQELVVDQFLLKESVFVAGMLR